MAFWGAEVKPGRPYTHLPENNTGRGRLHISQATLGSGNGEKKSVVQCNVGDKAPVLLCSLFPSQSESCQLNLEFDELHEVVFSVIGPHSVHLTGYYLPRSSHHFQNDESESYGEDIANTETERSDDDDDVGSEEDKYEDSFIDDGDTEVAPHSPIFSDVSKEISHRRKPKNKKISHRRLRKKYQLTLSEEDLSSQQNGATGMLTSDGENEDRIPISSLCKSSASSVSREEKKASEETGETIHKEVQDVTEREADGVVDGLSKSQPDKPKKKSKKQYKEEEQVKPETGDDFFFGTILKWDQAKESETKADQSNTDMTVIDDDNKKSENEIQPVQYEPILHSTEVGSGNGSKPKKKRKRQSKVEETVKAGSEDNFFFSAFVEPDIANENKTKTEEMSRDMTVINEDTDNYKTENTNQSGQHASIPSTQLDTDIGVKPKKKKKKQANVEEQVEAKSDGDFFSSTGEKTEQRETKANQSNQNMTVMDEENKGNENYTQSDHPASAVPSIQAGLENGVKPKRKKKKQSKVDEQVNSESEDVMQIKTKIDQSNQDMTLIDEDNKRTENNKHLSGPPSAEVGSENVVKPKKKRKKSSRAELLIKAASEDDHLFSTKADQTDEDATVV